MSAERSAGRDPLLDALGAVLEGVTFYDLAQRAVADTRVKVTFEELGRSKRDQLARLEASAGPTAKDAARPPGIFPLDVVSKVECYVCGYAVDTALMPTACPSCGAARYSFEKEIALSKAWEIAGAGARKSSDLFRTLAGKASGPSKPLLEALAREEDGTAAQADLHVAELRT
ncbi:MAG TPA: hypothetical protein VJ300_01950 [Thermoplasmata archaeon]|nr:hypothetical protein [Thermoplasmata archaeon]